ncbi:MAG: hypothetical protein R3298_07715 [Gammaproteobacteria bacterium]|nr:hypothetical protein [Gammaproteobacteria bacterium]
MIRSTIRSSACLATLLAVPLALQANTLRPTPDEVEQRIRIMETSVSASSVTPLYSENQRDAKLALLERARDQVERGNVTTALDHVEQAGRLLYPMERRDRVTLSDDKRREWLWAIDRVMDTVLPAAFGIAEEKGVVNDDLVTAASLREHGIAKLAAGDLEAADNLLVDAYNRMQAAVSELRSGERLVVSIERDDPRLAWAEAERRYQDWQVTSSWMQAMAPSMGADPQLIAEGLSAGDAIYREAVDLASLSRWHAAVETIDRAYLVMEEHWRAAGIDI